jgi:hypothetical protein
MKRVVVLLALFFSMVAGSAYAISFGGPGGEWPDTWPEELEPLRKQAWTWQHDFNGQSFDIPFTSREEFEAAWPHLLAVKGKGASITLLRGKHLRVDNEDAPGVCMNKQPYGKNQEMLMSIRLVVDGEIVDLNRIELPKDTPIIDERFTDEPPK